MENYDDDVPTLSAETLLALQQFYDERNEQIEKFNLDVKNATTEIKFEENWQLSQFWYDETTIRELSQACINACPPGGSIALISCPSLYQATEKIRGDRTVKLFEFDTRFAVFGEDFVKYDYNSPKEISQKHIGAFDVVVCDPPFLSQECLSKTSTTVKLLSKGKIVLCTGAVMNEEAEKCLKVKKCIFEPHHEHNLGNEFWCYANFDFDSCFEGSQQKS
ncbi:unnamed protein product [Trichogramma brassicae]|uniref:Protein-lysine N-methyltransferase TBRA_LOCUS5846 n=1 Tax=Trichogramma brassicae TaxID=86971 RepID=A0A6H5I9V5_9HYME|nr:unnamed protein product [Trichogramma brassicae]